MMFVYEYRIKISFAEVTQLKLELGRFNYNLGRVEDENEISEWRRNVAQFKYVVIIISRLMVNDVMSNYRKFGVQHGVFKLYVIWEGYRSFVALPIGNIAAAGLWTETSWCNVISGTPPLIFN